MSGRSDGEADASVTLPRDVGRLSITELAMKLPELPARKEILATGKAGTVYLCHPFLVHAAQPNHGTKPRFLAQPPLLLNSDFNIAGPGPFSPVEDAIRTALAG